MALRHRLDLRRRGSFCVELFLGRFHRKVAQSHPSLLQSRHQPALRILAALENSQICTLHGVRHFSAALLARAFAFHVNAAAKPTRSCVGTFVRTLCRHHRRNAASILCRAQRAGLRHPNRFFGCCSRSPALVALFDLGPLAQITPARLGSDGDAPQSAAWFCAQIASAHLRRPLQNHFATSKISSQNPMYFA